MADLAATVERPQTPDDRMSPEEKEAFVDKIEEFEGPDRREDRRDEKRHSQEPGVARS